MQNHRQTIFETVESLMSGSPEEAIRPLYILCKNSVDRLKWRIIFHENFPKPLLGIQFSTINNLFREVTEPYHDHPFIVSSHSFIFQSILESIISQNIPDWSGSQGIRKRISEVIDLIYWNSDQQDKILEKIKKEEKEKICLILSGMKDFFQKLSLIHEAEKISLLLKLKNFSHVCSHIFWLYPHDIDQIEQRQLKVIDHLLKPKWNIFSPEISDISRETFTLFKDDSVLNQTQKPWDKNIKKFISELKRETHFFDFIGIETKSRKKYTNFHIWKKENHSFFKTASLDKNLYQPEIKIWEANSFYSESMLIAKAIHKLIRDKKVMPHEIHILYQEPSQAVSLIHALKKNDLPVDAAFRMNIKGRGISYFISQWLTLLRVHQNNQEQTIKETDKSKVEIQLLFSFLKSPFCEVSYLCGRRSLLKVTDPVYWQKITDEFFLPQEAPLQSLIEYIQKKLAEKEQGQNTYKKQERSIRLGLKYFLNTLEKNIRASK